VIEPTGPESPHQPAQRRRATPPALVAWLLIAAIVGGAVGAGVTLGVLRFQGRAAQPAVDLGGALGPADDATAANVTQRSLPSVVSIVTRESNLAQGSGFLVSGDGFIVTNVGVVANSQTLAVLLNGDTHRHEARIVDFDCQTGVAVLKVDQVTNLPALALGDSTGLRLGQNVIALGGTLADHGSVTRGVVSGLHRTVSLSDPSAAAGRQLGNVIQMDTTIDPSMSGGPLLNAGGQVVGVNMATAGSQSQPAVFALASSDLQPVVEQVQQTGQLVVASLAAQVVTVSAADSTLRGATAGARVVDVAAGGPAERAGIRAGDVIVQVDDQRLDDAHPLAQVLRSRFKPDQKVTVTYVRSGSTTQVQLTLRGEHPPCP
jgi:S1-C subfamily serine protease